MIIFLWSESNEADHNENEGENRTDEIEEYSSDSEYFL